MTLELMKHSDFYNPYFLSTNDGLREVKEIRLFNEEGVLHTLMWFGDGHSGSVPVSFPLISEVVRKNKEDFKGMFQQGKAFWMPRKKEAHQRHYAHNFCILYLPVNKIDLKQESIEEVSIEFHAKTYDRVTYSVAGGQGYFSETKNERETPENRKNRDIDEAIRGSSFSNMAYEITRNFDELVELVRRIQAIKKRRE